MSLLGGVGKSGRDVLVRASSTVRKKGIDGSVLIPHF